MPRPLIQARERELGIIGYSAARQASIPNGSIHKMVEVARILQAA